MTHWLIDKSALVRLGSAADTQMWAERIERALVRISGVTRLELGYSARSGEQLRAAMRHAPVSSMPVVNLTPAMEERAVEVQALLGDRGHHRAAAVPDLLVAATAELTGSRVLHVDKDFELIAEITGQPVDRLET